jgi:V/A-type H+/Na+-transporting ATPase subunit E
MALEELLTSLREEASGEIAQLDAGARREAEEVLAEAERLAAEQAGRMLAEAEAHARAAAATAVAAARAEAGAARRSARERELTEVSSQVRLHLGQVRRSARGPTVLAALLDEARAVVPEADRVRVDPADAALARDLLAERGLRAEVVADLPTSGGVLLGDAEGRLVDNTLETRLAGAWPGLRRELVAGWAGAGGAP